MTDIKEEYAQPMEPSNYPSPFIHSPASIGSPFHSYVINHATLITEHDKKSQNLTMFYEPVSTIR